jgi:hypothetical protein
MLFAVFAGVFVTAAIISIIEWVDRPAPEALPRWEVWRRIVEARRRNE